MTDFVNRWCGTAAMPNGEVWFCPQDAGDFAILNVGAGTLTRNGFGLGFTGLRNSDKWHGCSQIGNILYVIPSTAAFVLRVDTVAKTAQALNYGLDLSDGFKW